MKYFQRVRVIARAGCLVVCVVCAPAVADQPSGDNIYAILQAGEDTDPVADLSELPKETDNWNNTLLTYVWVVSIDGEVRAGSSSADVNIEFADILDRFSGGASLIYEGHNDDWMVYFDGTALILEDEVSPTGIKLDIETTMAIAEGGIGHRITNEAFPKALVGLRYIGLDVEIDSSVGSAKSDFDSIFDPFVGIYHKHQFNDKWGLRALADIGGFGVGTDLSWGLGVGLTYAFERDWTAELGYRILDLDYDGDKIDFDGRLEGFYLGLGKSF